jgi:hypothetical protein
VHLYFNELLSVRRGDGGHEGEGLGVVAPGASDADRNAAAALESPHQCTLRKAGLGGGLVVDTIKHVLGGRVTLAELNGDSALADCVESFGGGQVHGDAVLKIEADEARSGENQSVVAKVLIVIELFEATRDVAAGIGKREVRVETADVGHTADGRGAYYRTRWEFREGAVGEAGAHDEGVTGIFARNDGTDDAVLGDLGGHIWNRILSGVPAAEERKNPSMSEQ